MLSSEERAALNSIIKEWRVFNHSADHLEIELEKINECVQSLYKHFSLPAPLIIFCRGPFQKEIFPALVELMLECGEADSRDMKFERHVLEDDISRQQWLAIWKECFSSIDWSSAKAGPDDRNFSLTKRMRAEIDNSIVPQFAKFENAFIDDDDKIQIAQAIRNELTPGMQRFRAAVAFSEPESRRTWTSFLARLPERFKVQLERILARKETVMSFRWDAPVPNSWLRASDFSWMAGCEFSMALSQGIPEDVRFVFSTYANLFKSAVEFLCCEHCCYVFVKPIEFHFDQAWRAHHESRAAVKFVDGSTVYFWHGVEVPERIILHPEKIKIRDIERAENTEIQRVMIERYGLEQFLRMSLAKVIHEDRFGILYRLEMPGAEAIFALKVTNSTAEPDGSFKEYFIRVPPTMQTARQAVAWTFGLDEFDYSPEQES